MDDKEKKNEIIKAMIDIEYRPTNSEEVKKDESFRVPFSRIAAWGTAFESLAGVFQSIINGGKNMSGLYHVTVPVGKELAKFRNKPGLLGSVLTESGTVGGGQAVLNPISINPTALFMAAMLANIDRKLDVIQESQLNILNFLEQKEKSEMRGDLNFLSDILNNYKFNWENEKYKNSNHIKVLDIKQAAERKIDFFHEQITTYSGKTSLFNMDQDINKQIDKVLSEFKDYQLALYIFSFSSFVEIILLENYQASYLDSVASKINNYTQIYSELYNKCYEQIEKRSKSSIQSFILKGLSKANTTAGKAIANVPIISKSQFDENLIKTGDKLKNFNDKRTEQVMQQLIGINKECTNPFVDNIQTINFLYNKPVELLFDEEAIYIGSIN